ncbi:MAG: TonB-dependent receptor domain-containing protein, partial [Sandaracinobacteroides sp.]
GRIETSGVDITAAYGFGIGEHGFNLRVTANWVEKLNRFFNPTDSSQVNPGLLEQGAPEWAGVGSIGWTSPGGFGLVWRTQYIGRQAIAGAIEIESIESEFGEAGFADATWIHDISASFEWNEGFEIYGGINNLTNVEPFIASRAYPVSGVGRFYFLGMRAKF